MSLRAQLEGIKSKPAHVRDRWALVGAIIGTAIIAIIWAINLTLTFGTPAPTTGPLTGFHNFINSNALQVWQGLKVALDHLLKLIN